MGIYLRKSTFYVRVKVPKRLGAREIRLCLRTHKLSVAILVLERLLPLISSLKQVVIRSRTLGVVDLSRLLLQQLVWYLYPLPFKVFDFSGS